MTRTAELAAAAVAIVLIIAIAAAVLWARFAISNAAASVHVFSPEPGVHCVRVTTADGVAVDCWQVQQ